MALRLNRQVLLVARGSAIVVAAVIASSASIGWLYWLRAHTLRWPGPRIADALPLDELPTHSGVPLLLFLLAFVLGAVLVGLAARALRVDGLSAALVTGGVVAIWLYVTSAVSLFVVRQVPFDVALDDTRSLEVVYVGAAVFAISVGLVAKRPARGLRLSRLAIASVALLGVVDLFVGMTPRGLAHHGVFAVLATGALSPESRAVSVTLGALLLLALAGLERRSKRAARFALVLTVLSLLLPLFGGFSVAMTVLAALVALALHARRQDFAFPGDPAGHGAALLFLTATAVTTLVYGLLALFINRAAADLPFQFTAALSFILHELVGQSPSHQRLLSAGFGEWFPWSLRGIAGLGLLRAVAIWFAPWRQRLAGDRRGGIRAAGIVQNWGIDSLAPFALRTDKAYFFYPETASAPSGNDVLIAYRALRGIALVSGDPIGPTAAIGPAIGAFRAYCAERGWKVAVLGASDRYLEAYKELGLRALYHGEEAIVDTATFSLAGGTLKAVRQAAHRLARNGYTVEVTAAGNLDSDERGQLLAVETTWLEGKARKGFVMELDELFRLDGDDAVFVVGRDRAGTVVGFLEFAVCPASESLSLSSMPRAAEAPNGLNAFLIVATIGWAAEHGFSAVSLNFSPFAKLLDPHATLGGLERVERSVLLMVKRLLNLQFDNLLAFNRHFAPRWQRRFLVYERRRHLARIALVAMAAERYLPFPNLLRGRRWAGETTAEDRMPGRRVAVGGTIER